MSLEEHRWRFFRAGGVDQVAIRDGQDIARLRDLDQKLWVALAMPTRGLSLEDKTLKLLDADGDGRIRVPDVLSAIDWLQARLETLDVLMTPGDSLPLGSIRDEPLRGQARRVLENLATRAPATSAQPAETDQIALAQVIEVLQRYTDRPFNGDGVVIAEAMPDDETRTCLDDIIAALGGDTDRSGKPGLGKAKLDTFFDQARTLVAWSRRPEENGQLLPLGEGTAAAAEAVAAVRDKVDDFFLRCRLAAFDERAACALLPAQAELGTLAGKALSVASPELRGLPLARPVPGRALPLRESINPGWARELEQLAGAAVMPLLGARSELDETEWTSVKAKLLAYQEWQAAKPASQVESLGLARLRQLLDGKLQERLDQLINEDLALRSEVDLLAALEKLLLFRRDLGTVLHNFVNFARFYGRSKDGAVFQAGTLYIDGRACRLCLEVVDTAKHGLLATMASTFLLYCDCSRADGQKKTIVAAVTAGDSDRLVVGRNGVFYDRQGHDWDATVTRIVSHPISVGEAF